MSANAMSLKAKIRNLARQKNIPAQVILQNYMFERFLLRLSVSDFRDKFVIKGGMLIAAIFGLDNRATMDLDATLKNLPLTPESIQTAMQDICSIDLNDDVTFVVGTISSIREDDIYGGYRVMITAQYDTIHTPLFVDISTGDAMTPDAVNCTFNGIFDEDLSFTVWAYNIETVMAEKVETILRRSVFNTRPRDYYDAYILFTTSVLTKSYSGKHYPQRRHIGELLGKLKIYQHHLIQLLKARNCRICGTGIEISLLTPKISIMR